MDKSVVLTHKTKFDFSKNQSFGIKLRFDSSKIETGKPYDIGASMTLKL